MKRISRMLIFSGIAVYLTALWNKGFLIKFDPYSFIILTLLVAAICYLIVPLSRIILLPINFITFGLLATVVYVFLIYLLDQNTDLLQIREWIFAEITYLGLHIANMKVSYLQNLFISSFSISSIINLLEKLV